jgi:hypothetical protein
MWFSTTKNVVFRKMFGRVNCVGVVRSEFMVFLIFKSRQMYVRLLVFELHFLIYVLIVLRISVQLNYLVFIHLILNPCSMIILFSMITIYILGH